ncbi:MAG: AMP-binding protein, partial [Candidatus Aminicenantes bacterium]
KEPVQLVLKRHHLEPRYYDLQKYGNDNDLPADPGKRVNGFIEEIKAKDRDEGFDLHQVPFRVTLGKIHEKKFFMILSYHHILIDGWSTGIILDEFFKAYDDLSRGRPLIVPMKTKFKEFIRWFQKRDIHKEKEFWKNYLKGFDTQIELSIKRKRRKPKVITKMVSVRFETTGVNHFIRKHKITLATLFYTAWGLLLQKYNNSNDVIFGTTVSGRTAGLEGIEEMVGLFINTLPLRVQGSPGERAIDLLHRLDLELQMRRPYEYTPLVNIKETSEIDKKEELFDSIVVVENYPLSSRLKSGELSLCSYSIKEMTHYDLTIAVTGPGISGNDLGINFSYKTGVLDKKSIERLSLHFVCILQDMMENPGKKVLDLEILPGEEKCQLLVDFNQAEAPYPKDKFLHQIFAEQVKRSTDGIALHGCMDARMPGEIQVTYGELDEKTGQLAHLLRGKGVMADTIVGIKVDRSVEMVIGILGILKAGGAYLPIDPGYPEERIRYMLNDSNAKILLTSREIAVLSSPEAFNNRPKGTSLLAYIIYTSGSTGHPKGVMVDHASIVNTLSALDRMYPFTPSDVYLLKTSYLFDVSLTELFGWFFGNKGGRLVVLEPGGEKDPAKILDTIEKMNITHINFVPSMFNVFVDQLTNQSIGKLLGLKYIFLAGEALLPELVNKFRRLDSAIPLEDLYGPTEAAIYASRYSLADWSGSSAIPIGKPIQN